MMETTPSSATQIYYKVKERKGDDMNKLRVSAEVTDAKVMKSARWDKTLVTMHFDNLEGLLELQSNIHREIEIAISNYEYYTDVNIATYDDKKKGE